MPQPIEIHLPCDVLRVKVRVGPQEHLSPLEELFLRAVHGGISHFQELAGLFGIGHRPTLDLIFDLWHRGYVVLDLRHGAVLLTSAVSQTITDGKVEELSSGEAADEVREIMLDKLTGHVLPVGGRRSQPSARATVPVEHFDIGMRDITPSDLLSALGRVIEDEDRRAPRGRARRVLAAYLSPTDLLVTPERRWLRLYVACTRNNDTGNVSVEVIDGGELSSSARATVARRLSQLIEDAPDSTFTQHLLESVGLGIPTPRDVDLDLSALQNKIAGLEGVDIGLIPRWHQDLSAVACAIEDWCFERRDAEVDVLITVGHDEHQAALVSLIDGAQRQLVLACPWIRYSAIQPLLLRLHEALDRGVQVFLLWGMRPDDELEQPIRSALLQLGREFPTRLFVSTRSSRTHAKLVIQDDRRALVTSLNFLSPSQLNTFELGVLLAPRAVDAACPAIEELLDWARSSYPEYTGSESMYRTRDDFTRVRPTRTTYDFGINRPVMPSFADESAVAARAGDLDHVAAHLWIRSWRDHYEALAEARAAQSTTGRVTRDGQHRDMLWRGLRGANRRLLITSDQLGPEVVDDRFVQALEERVKAGVAVTLLYRRPAQHATVGGADPAAALAALAERYPEQVRVASQPTHAKILAFDDVVVISSFNFLSFEGLYEERRPGLRRRQWSEVGVALADDDLADRVIAAVGGAFPGATETLPQLQKVSDRSDVPATVGAWSPSQQQELLRALSESSDLASRWTVLRNTFSLAADAP